VFGEKRLQGAGIVALDYVNGLVILLEYFERFVARFSQAQDGYA
jgi:hypothetical protein